MIDYSSYGPSFLRVTLAEPQNSASIAGLHAELFSDAWSQETCKHFILSAAHLTFVAYDAREDHKIIGFLILQFLAPEAEIITLGVSRSHQTLGVGSELLKTAVETLGREGCEAIFLEVEENNIAAKRLYEKFGFAPNGRRPGYYLNKGRRSDALLLKYYYK